MESTQAALPGSLAWPGDLDLLQRYGVTTSQIAERLTEIIRGIQSKAHQDSSNACSLEDRFKIKEEKVFSREIRPCGYCHEELEHHTNYRIENSKTKEALLVSNIMLHLIKEHSDLGDPGSARMAPTHTCRVLELGDTFLEEKDPLFEVAKFEKWDKQQIEQKKIDDETLAQLQLSSDGIAFRLNEVVEKRKTVIDGRLELSWELVWGNQTCYLCEPVREFKGYYHGSLKNLISGEQIPLSTLGIHTVAMHGYFGKNAGTRIDPKKVAEILGISSPTLD